MADGQLSEFEPGDGFRLGGAEYVEVWIRSRSEAADYWDGNWIDCEVRLCAGGFRGHFSANLRATELEGFTEEVRTLYQQFNGTARFACPKEQLRFVLEGNGRGWVQCKGRARDNAGTGNVLDFHFELDGAQLYSTMTELAKVLKRYPVRGSPAA